jgi:hypothetical protein
VNNEAKARALALWVINEGDYASMEELEQHIAAALDAAVQEGREEKVSIFRMADREKARQFLGVSQAFVDEDISVGQLAAEFTQYLDGVKEGLEMAAHWADEWGVRQRDTQYGIAAIAISKGLRALHKEQPLGIEREPRVGIGPRIPPTQPR